MASIEPYLVTSLALTAVLGSLCRKLEVSSGKMTLSSKILMACGKWIRSSPLSSRRNSRDVSPKPAPIFFGKSLSNENFSNRGLFCPNGPQLQLAMIDKMIKLWWEARNMFLVMNNFFVSVSLEAPTISNWSFRLRFLQIYSGVRGSSQGLVDTKRKKWAGQISSQVYVWRRRLNHHYFDLCVSECACLVACT